MKTKIEYLFSCLSEEAGEIVQCVGKIERFGLGDRYKDNMPNDVALGRELTDLIAIVEMLEEEGVQIPGFMMTPLSDNMRVAIETKKEKVRKYMQYSRERGTLIGD